jgi:hypothetical protein
MDTGNSLAQIAASRHKRLKYWQERLVNNGTHGSGTASNGKHNEAADEIQQKLNTYCLLLSKLVKAPTEDERQQSEQRLVGLDRELTSLFEARRLMTSRIGVPAVGDK